MHSKIFTVAILLSSVAWCGSTGHWIGAADNFWTNASNWAESRIPGRYLASDVDGNLVTNGVVGDTAIFGDDLTSGGTTTINMTGTYSISNIVCTGTQNRYTFGTTETTQYVPLEPGAYFIAADQPDTPVAKIFCRIRFGVECMHGYFNSTGTWVAQYGADTITFRNNSATEEFLLDKYDWGTVSPLCGGGGGQTGLRTEGTGDIRVLSNGCKPFFYAAQTTGRLIVNTNVQFKVRAFYVRSEAAPYPVDTTTQRQIEICKNAVLGPSEGNQNYMTFDRPTRFYGEGSLGFGAARSGSGVWGCQSGAIAKEVQIDCHTTFYVTSNGGATEDNGGYAFPYKAFFNTSASNARGPVVFAGTSDFGPFADGCEAVVASVTKSGGTVATIAAYNLGQRGTYGNLGNCDIELANSTFRYLGAGETTDRKLWITNLASSVNSTATIEQNGTGTLTLTSEVATRNGTGVLVLAGESAAGAVFAGTLAEGVSVQTGGTCPWTFSPANGPYTGAIAFGGGTLVLDAANLPAFSAISAMSGTASTLLVPSGATFALNTMPTMGSGGQLDIRLENGASVTTAALAGQKLPAGITLNGHSASFNAQGTLEVDTVDHVWKTALDGDWFTAANWINGVPDAMAPVAIDVPVAADYTVTFDGTDKSDADCTVTNLVVDGKNIATPILAVAHGKLTISGAAPGQTINTAFFKVQNGARLVVTNEAEVRVENNEYVNGTPHDFKAGEIDFSGTTRLTLAGVPPKPGSNGNGHNVFNCRHAAFREQSSIAFEGRQPTPAISGNNSVFYFDVRPSARGLSAVLDFKDDFTMVQTGATRSCYELNVGAFDTGYGGHAVLNVDLNPTSVGIPLFHANSIGYRGGVGELNILRGKVTGSTDKVAFGTPGNANNNTSLYCATGLLTVAEGGTMDVECTYGRDASQALPKGIILGDGLCSSKDTSFFYGRAEIAGTVQNRYGYLLVGSGMNAKGEYLQTGGSYVGFPFAKNSTWVLPDVCVGIFGGQGSFKLSGGTFRHNGSFYAGGVTTNELHRYLGATAGLHVPHHDAQGLVEVSGGTLTVTNQFVLGRDGTGTLVLTGTGTVAAATLVVSNTTGQADSALVFRTDAQGRCGTLAAATRLKFFGGKLRVDLSATPNLRHGFNVLALDEPVEGLVSDTLELVGDEPYTCPHELAWSDDGRTLRFTLVRGMKIILR